MRPWLGEIVCPPAVASKLRLKHGIGLAAVEEAIRGYDADKVAWHEHETYGTRLVATGTTTTGRGVQAFLRPLDEADGRWLLLTAYYV